MFVFRTVILFLLLVVSTLAAPVPDVPKVSFNVDMSRVSPYFSELARYTKYTVGREIEELVDRLPASLRPEQPPKDDIFLARSMEDNIFITARGNEPGIPHARNQIIGRRDGVVGSANEIFDMAA